MEGEKSNGRRRYTAANLSDLARYHKTNVRFLVKKGCKGIHVGEGDGCYQERGKDCLEGCVKMTSGKFELRPKCLVASSRNN